VFSCAASLVAKDDWQREHGDGLVLGGRGGAPSSHSYVTLTLTLHAFSNRIASLVSSDTLVPAQGLNQQQTQIADRRDSRIFPARGRHFDAPNSYGCPDWVPQPSMSKRT